MGKIRKVGEWDSIYGVGSTTRSLRRGRGMSVWSQGDGRSCQNSE